jgi:predicted DsbA family dithiol-disulfide isomerase
VLSCKVSRRASVVRERGRGVILKVRIISDYICPWCYIGLARAERLAQEFPVELEPWPFELRPDLPNRGLPREIALGRHYPPEYFMALRRYANEEGLELAVPESICNTHNAHEATHFAYEAGKGWQFHRAVFLAFWERGEPIGEVDVLCRLAEECELDSQALRQALSEGRYRALVDERVRWAREQGIAGVPTFVFGEGEFSLVGAQEYSVFRDVTRRLLAKMGGAQRR